MIYSYPRGRRPIGKGLTNKPKLPHPSGGGVSSLLVSPTDGRKKKRFE